MRKILTSYLLGVILYTSLGLFSLYEIKLKAAASHQQTCSAQGTVSPALVTCTTTPGNAILVTLVLDGTNTPTQGVSDTDTLTISTATINNSGALMSHYSNYSIAGGVSTYSFTFTNQSWAIFATEVSGLAASGFDQKASTTFHAGALTTDSGTTPTTTLANEFALASANNDGSGGTTTSSASNGFTVPMNGDRAGGTGGKGAVAYKVLTACGAINSVFTFADNVSGTGLISTWKASGGAACSATRKSGLLLSK